MNQEKTTYTTFSNSPTFLPPSTFVVSLPSCILISSGAMEGTRSAVLACWGTGRVRSAGSRRDIDLQCLLRSIATPHNYRALRASHSPFLPCSPLFLFLPSVSLFRTHPVPSLISSPCSATLVSDYQYRRRCIIVFLSPFFFVEKNSSKMTRA